MSEFAHRHLRSAIEFAVLMAAEGQKRKPAIPYPKELKPFFGKSRVPAGALGRLRRVIEADALFRSRIAAGALPELVDEIGRLWLTQPDGWESAADELASAIEAEVAAGDLDRTVKRAERRREAAEQVAARTRAELQQLNEIIAAQGTELHSLRADVVKADDSLAEMRTELVDVRVEIRHARDREAAAIAKSEDARRELADALSRLERFDSGSDAARDVAAVDANNAQIVAAADAARLLADQLEALAAPAEDQTDPRSPRQRGPRRVPLALPGGVISTSAEAAAFLVRSDAALLIDGYNVAKLGWPNRSLDEQRRNLLDAVENLARRHGTEVTVVFDGASIVGAHADRRRLARVVYSPAGVTADDVIRTEVSRLPSTRAVVVATSDAEIVRDVRAAGANVLASNALLAVL